MAQTPYYWVPLDDDAYSFYARQRATVTSGYVLPHTDGTYPCDQRNRNWTDLKGYDQINICAHGVATNLSVVGWSTSNGVAKELKAAGVKGRLSAYKGAYLLNAGADHTAGSSRITSGLLAGKNC